MKPHRGTSTVVAALFTMLVVWASLPEGVGPVFAQPAPASSEIEALKREVERLKRQVEAIHGEVKGLREHLLRGPVTSRPQETRIVSRVSVEGRPSLGKKDAPVTIVEFSDYQCPFCRRYFHTTFPTLKKEYVDTGKLRYVFRDFPLDSLHPHARKAAEAAHCAGDQGKFWAMHDLLFNNQQGLEVDKLKAHARALKLNGPAFDGCLDTGKHAGAIETDRSDGVAAGINGTPGFFLGKTRSDGAIESVLIVGARPVAVFREAIESLIKQD